MNIKDLNLHRYTHIALIIVIIGGINWGLVGLLRLDIISAIFGFNILSRLLYIIIGLATALLCYVHFIDTPKTTITTTTPSEPK